MDGMFYTYMFYMFWQYRHFTYLLELSTSGVIRPEQDLSRQSQCNDQAPTQFKDYLIDYEALLGYSSIIFSSYIISFRILIHDIILLDSERWNDIADVIKHEQDETYLKEKPTSPSAQVAVGTLLSSSPFQSQADRSYEEYEGISFICSKCIKYETKQWFFQIKLNNHYHTIIWL